LDIAGPEATEGTLRMSDLETDEEDQVVQRMRGYERKIDGLMSQVGSLRNEVELQRTLRELEHKDDLLETSRRALEAQEDELLDIQTELNVTETENKKLRRSVNRLKETAEMSM
jgi:outer dense fiber protein 2